MATWEDVQDVIRTRFVSQVQDVTTVATIAGTVFSMDAADNSLNRSSGSFLTDGLRSQYKVSISGFTDSGNNVSFRCDSVTATKVILSGNTVTTEVAGDSVSIAVRLPVHFENAPKFEPPSTELGWTWAAVTTNMETGHVEIGGNNRFRHAGVATVELFAPRYIGTESITQLAQTTATAFRTVTVSGVTFRTPSMRGVGSDGSFYKRNVDCPFIADEVVAA